MNKVETKVKQVQVVEVSTSIDNMLFIFIGHNAKLFDHIVNTFTDMDLLQMECCVSIGIKNDKPCIVVKLTPDSNEINRAKDMAPMILKNIVSTLETICTAVVAFAKGYRSQGNSQPSVEKVVLGS